VLKKSYDIVVVGAGPQAHRRRSAASAGMRVLIVERKTAVGVP